MNVFVWLCIAITLECTLVDMFVCTCLAEHVCTYLERQCMHSPACSPAERITVEHGMIFGVQSDTVQGYTYTLTPAHINVGSIDVVTPSLIWHLEDDP